MSKHPFRVAIETNANKKDLGKLFTADAVIEAPMLTKSVKGADDVLNIISHVAKLAGPITYTLELRDSKQTILFWEGKVGGFVLHAATILVDDEDGLIREPGCYASMARSHGLSQRHVQGVIWFFSAGLLGTATEAGKYWQAAQVDANRPEADRTCLRYDAA
jgi:hypothetical protein